MRRIPIRTLLAPATIYQHAAHYAEGYRPTANSRFAVVRQSPDDTWSLVHIRSGKRVDAALPAAARKLTMTDKLTVAAAWEGAAHLDWSAFDALNEIKEGATGKPSFGNLTASQLATMDEMRKLAATAISARRA